LLICASGKPAFSREEMAELEEEYGCTFLYGQALCLARYASGPRQVKMAGEGR